MTGTLGGVTRSDDGYYGGVTRSDDGYFGGGWGVMGILEGLNIWV